MKFASVFVSFLLDTENGISLATQLMIKPQAYTERNDAAANFIFWRGQIYNGKTCT